MAVRRVIEIDKDLCNGCGICVDACHEGAIGMIDGKATLLRDDYCDGLGDCLPNCPTGAISFVVREALDFDKEAVEENMRRKKEQENTPKFVGCPGKMAKAIERNYKDNSSSQNKSMNSQLGQWPVQIKLVPENAAYFDNARLLIAADCSAFAYGNFHNDYIKNHVCIIGCPKLDDVDYSEKLTNIIKNNNIKSVTIVRMEVPCCGGLEMAVKKALQDSGKFIPWQIDIISTDGRVLA